MISKIDMSVSYDDEIGYIISFDEGLREDFVCYIDEKDMVSINYGDTIYSDYKETRKRRKQIIKEMLFDKLIGEENISVLDQEEFYFEGIFKKFEKYIIDNDVFVENESIVFPLEEKEYESFFDKDSKNIIIVINNKLIRDEFGITINEDGSFGLYTKRPIEELSKEQVDFLQNMTKDFIKRNLGIAINFGRDLNGPIKIKSLYNSALKLFEQQMYKDSEKGNNSYGK